MKELLKKVESIPTTAIATSEKKMEERKREMWKKRLLSKHIFSALCTSLFPCCLLKIMAYHLKRQSHICAVKINGAGSEYYTVTPKALEFLVDCSLYSHHQLHHHFLLISISLSRLLFHFYLVTLRLRKLPIFHPHLDT